MSKDYFDIIKQYWDKSAVTEPLHSQMSPNAHTADLLTRARYRAEGAQTERERIIKLLEDNNKCTGGLSFGNCTCTALALIKGEQK
jgi:hypothetical protein